MLGMSGILGMLGLIKLGMSGILGMLGLNELYLASWESPKTKSI